MIRVLLFLVALAVSLPVAADMYPDASNAKLPEARANLGAWPTVDAKADLGCVGNGVADDSACIAAAVAKTGSPTIYFPAGTYLFNCATAYTFASSATMVGAGRVTTTLKVQPGCALLGPGGSSGLFNMNNGNGGGWRDITLDLNGAVDPSPITGSNFTAIFRYSCQNAFLIDNFSMINVGDNSIAIFAVANGCNSHNWTIRNSRIQINNPSNASGSSGGISMGGGTASFNNIHIDGNRIEGGGVQTTGENVFVTNNDISGFSSGTGLFQVQVISRRHIFTGNIIRDSATTFDVNGTPAGGIELNGEYSVFANNQCRNLGGSCVILFGSYNLIEGNTSQGTGTAVPPNEKTSGAYQVVENTGPSYPGTPRPPTDNVIQNNIDYGGPNSLYSYYERAGDVPHVNTIVRNNYFSGYTQAAYYVLNPTTKVTPSANETLISNVTTNQVAKVSNTVYKPGGATLSTINEISAQPSVTTTSTPVAAMRGFLSQPSLTADFTGTLAQMYGYDFAPINTSAVLPGTIIGYSAGGAGTGNGATSGAYLNYGFFAGAATAAAGTGATLLNVGLRASPGTGSSATTTNRGIWITGNGGALSTNFAIYSDSTARSYFAGPMTMTALPTSAGAGGLAVCVDSAGVLYKKASCP